MAALGNGRSFEVMNTIVQLCAVQVIEGLVLCNMYIGTKFNINI